MIGGQGEDSSRKSEVGEIPQERTQRGDSLAAPGKQSPAPKSTAMSQSYSLSVGADS
ncbi:MULTISPECIES: hypothetical protein [Priestia]|uniref:hypothetical protein n=1 Tax=Priestia TaxID=2800373 RepID=UPI00146FDB24|nr:hypothetical protein [Priestia aryabhattai]